MDFSSLSTLPTRRFLVTALAGAAVTLALAVTFASLAEGDSVMKRTAVRILMPRDDRPKAIKGMFMGSHQQETVAEITSIRLKSLPEQGVDPVKVVWVVTMSSTRSITQVVNLRISLRDVQDKRLVTARGRLSIATRTQDKEFEVKMKVKAAAWQSSVKVDLQADWIS